MILNGNFAENVMMHPEIMAYPIHPQATSGVIEGDQAIYKYSLRDTDYPILTIVDRISDSEGDLILPGHYELALSDEKDFLIIMQSKNPVAIIPAFKIEEDKSAYNKKYSKKYLKQKKKENKERKETNRKRAMVGMSPDEETVFMKAEIEYNKEHKYYLIKYERGPIRAWGAIKG